MEEEQKNENEKVKRKEVRIIAFRSKMLKYETQTWYSDTTGFELKRNMEKLFKKRFSFLCGILGGSKSTGGSIENIHQLGQVMTRRLKKIILAPVNFEGGVSERGGFIDYDHPSYDKNYREFGKLLKLKRKRIVPKARSEDSESTFARRIIPTGFDGPLCEILGYIDILELLVNFIYVNRAFYQSVMEMIDRKMIQVEEDHMQFLFGRHSWVNEPLFLKLVKSMPLKTINTYFNSRPTQHRFHCQFPTINIMMSSLSLGYKKVLTYLLSLENLKISKEIFRYCHFERLEEMIEFLIRSGDPRLFSKTNVKFSSSFYKYLSERNRGDLLLELLQKDNKSMKFVVAHGVFGRFRNGKYQPYNLEMIKLIDQQFPMDMNDHYSDFFRYSYRFWDWKTIEYILSKKKLKIFGIEDDDADNQEQKQNLFKFHNVIERREEFFKYYFEDGGKEKITLIEFNEDRMKFYRTCYEIYKEDSSGVGKEKVKEAFQELKSTSLLNGINDRNLGRGRWYFKYEAFDVNIAQIVSSLNIVQSEGSGEEEEEEEGMGSKPAFKIQKENYYGALEHGKFELAKFLKKFAFEEQGDNFTLEDSTIKVILYILCLHRKEKEAIELIEKICPSFMIESYQNKKFHNYRTRMELSTFLRDVLKKCVEEEMKEICELLFLRFSKHGFMGETFHFAMVVCHKLLGNNNDTSSSFGNYLVMKFIENELNSRSNEAGDGDKNEKIVRVFGYCIRFRNIQIAKHLLEKGYCRSDEMIQRVYSICLYCPKYLISTMTLNDIQIFLKNSLGIPKIDLNCSVCKKCMNVIEESFEKVVEDHQEMVVCIDCLEQNYYKNL